MQPGLARSQTPGSNSLASFVQAGLAEDPAIRAGRRATTGTTIDGYPGDELELLGMLLGFFEESEIQTEQSRRASERARDFVDGNQWTPQELRALQDRHQPVIWNNIIGRKIDLLRGMERRGRSDPKAFPRTPTEDNRADVATQVLRYIGDDNRFDVIRSAVYDNMLVEGFGGAEVVVEEEESPAPGRDALLGSSALAPQQQGPSYRVVANYIPWERLFYDPHSKHPGFTDSKYLGIVIWSDYEDAIERWPGCEGILQSTFEASRSDTYDDRPSFIWCDRQRRRVRVIQIYWQRGKDWWTATCTHGGFLEPAMKSPYIDRHGNATCQLIMRSAKVSRDNSRFGPTHDMIPLQQEINKRHSKLLHSLSVNQLLFEEGAIEDVDKARSEAARPDGVIVFRPGMKFEVRKDSAEIAGQFELLKHAVEQMNVAGPNAAMSGKDPREQSGRAIIAQQAGGQTENEAIIDELRQWTHKMYEACWMRARQFWNVAKVIRVTDEQRNMQFLTLNRPVTLQEELQQMPPDQAQMLMARLQLQPGDRRLQAVVRVEHNLDDMDVDITVEEGPDTPTVQIEQYQAMMALPESILSQFPPEFFIQANPSLRNKEQLIGLIEAHQKAQAQQQQVAQQGAQALQAAQIANVQASTADKSAQAVERAHRVATDHATLAGQPIMPGVGAVAPEQNPLLQPAPAAAPQPAGQPAPQPAY